MRPTNPVAVPAEEFSVPFCWDGSDLLRQGNEHGSTASLSCHVLHR